MRNDIRARIGLLNPWIRDAAAYVGFVRGKRPRLYVQRAVDRKGFGDPGRVKLIVGPRKTGKSTYLWQCLADLPPQSVLLLDCRESLVRTWYSSPAGMVRDLLSEYPGVETVVFENVGREENLASVIAAIQDAKIGLNLFILGTISSNTLKRFEDHLDERLEKRILLSFSQFELFSHQVAAVPALYKVVKRKIAERLTCFGGYPEAWFSEDPVSALSSLYESSVLEDLIGKFRLKRTEILRMLLQLLARKMGDLLNYSELADRLGASVTMVRDYVSILEDAWVMRRTPPFVGGRRREISSAPKIHFYDMGVRNAAVRAFNADIPVRVDADALFKGMVFSELSKTVTSDWTVHYWRTKGGAEMDFVLVSGERRIAVALLGASRKKMTRSIRSFISSYQPEMQYLVTFDERPPFEAQVQGTDVRQIWLPKLSEHLTPTLRHS